MKVYELIQRLCNFDADTEVYIHGAAHEWHAAEEALHGADTDAEYDAAERRLAAAEETPETSPVDVSEFETGKVVIS